MHERASARVGKMLTLLVTCQALLLGCSQRDVPSSLVLITVDTTRADRLGPYGYASAKTPTFDRLATEGTLYTRAYSVAPETLPAHTSIMTGLYPPSHGVRLNLSFRLPDEAVTLAEILRDEGRHTVAVTSSAVLDRRYGLNQGFLVYNDPRSDRKLERPAQEVTESALSALEQVGTRPFFLWAHYYDPHSPFDPPQPFQGNADFELESPELYDREIAYMDHWIGQLLDNLESRGLLATTLVAVVGDHGESLGEHGETYHTLFVYDSTIHVPMILVGPSVAAGGRVDQTVSAIDIFATVLALLDLEPPAVSSRMLPGLPVSRSDGPDRIAYSESMAPPLRFGWRGLEAVRTPNWLYIRAPDEELYRADGSDRSQEVNLAYEQIAALGQMSGVLDDSLAAMPVPQFSTNAGRQATDEEREALEALGYVSAGDKRGAKASGQDPKDMVEVAEAVQLARLAQRLGDLDQAVDLLTWAVGADTENFGTTILLARLHARRANYPEARASFERTLEIRPGRWEVLTELAAVEEQAGRAGRSQARLGEALAASPSKVEVWRRLGRLRLRAEEWQLAAEAFERVLELEPGDARAITILERLRTPGGLSQGDDFPTRDTNGQLSIRGPA